jgi:phosphoadenosine phosphosulfate reductase
MIRYDLISKRYGRLDGADLLEPLIKHVFPGRIALVSSFGLESAVLLHMVAKVDRATPVVFLDTGKLFGETRRYRREIVEHLGLTDVRTVTPLEPDAQSLDPDGTLWTADPDLCCHFRKVEPLERALQGFQAWITGRKRFHGGSRGTLQSLETADWRLKVNPLSNWTPEDIRGYFEHHDLPRHALEEQGYTSVGCMPCTSLPSPDGGARSGRWEGSNKTECGIHWSANGKPIKVRRSA